MSSSIDICEISLFDKSLELFLSLPTNIYADDHNYIPINQKNIVASLNRKAFINTQKLFIAKTRNQLRGRLVARHSDSSRDTDGSPLGMIGFFEAYDEFDMVTALFERAISYLKDQGCKRIVGPIDGDTWHKYRFNTGPFDEPPFFMEPYNRSYYPKLWEQYGFSLLEKYCSVRVDDTEAILPKLNTEHKQATKCGYTFRSIDLNHFENELDILYSLTNGIFADNFLFTEVSRADYGSLYSPVFPLLKSEHVWFALDSDETPVGFVFAIPDYFLAVKSMDGKGNYKAYLVRSRKRSATLPST